MKLRRTVHAPKLWDYLRFRSPYQGKLTNLGFNTQLFNLFTFFVALALASLALGLLRPQFWSLTLASVVLLSFQHLRTHRLAHGLAIRRRVPALSREKSVVVVQYEISNATAFALPAFEFLESFEGVKGGQFRVKVERVIPAHTKVFHAHKITLDGGMGVKLFAPLSVHVRDVFEMFDFEVRFQERAEIEVYPLIEETPPLKTAVSPEAITFGPHDVPRRGDSNLFIGTRPYQHGDPVKYINWRLTKKAQEVVVNIFERSTNAYVTLLIDLDLKNQVGAGAYSSWEGQKDFALSLCANEIERGNLVQVISHNLHIPFGTGRHQLALFERHFTHHELATANDQGFMREVHSLPPDGQIVYLAPFLSTGRSEETFELLKKLRLQGQRVSIFLVNPLTEVSKSVDRGLKVFILDLERQAQVAFERHKQSFHNLGVPLVVLKVGESSTFREQLLKLAAAQLELK